jgi:hypothetical protein
LQKHVGNLGRDGLTEGKDINGKTLRDRIQEENGNILEHFGFNINLHSNDALEIVCMMLIDDGLKSVQAPRSRQRNLFNEHMNVGAVACAVHRDLEVICGVVLCQGYYKTGEAHPLESQVQAFLAEEDDVDFAEPENTTGAYKQTSRVDVEGLVATKTVEREYFMKGSGTPPVPVTGQAKPGKSLRRTLKLGE